MNVESLPNNLEEECMRLLGEAISENNKRSNPISTSNQTEDIKQIEMSISNLKKEIDKLKLNNQEIVNSEVANSDIIEDIKQIQEILNKTPIVDFPTFNLTKYDMPKEAQAKIQNVNSLLEELVTKLKNGQEDIIIEKSVQVDQIINMICKLGAFLNQINMIKTLMEQ